MERLEAPDLTHTIELRDGRTLGFIDIGDPGGYPVISHHGGLSSRLDNVPADDSAKAHHLRLICADRPGVGLSDRQEGRTMADWADDVSQLVDALGIDRFATMGWSYGGGFAQAVGHYLGDRVSVMVLVASTIPADWEGMRADIDAMDRVFLKMTESTIGQFKARTIFHLMEAGAHFAPKRWGRAAGYPGESPEQFGAAIAAGLSDVRGVVDEYTLMNAPWGFDPSEITVPTQIWQGDADKLVPQSWGPRLHEAIASSTLTIVPGATHFLWYDHWDDIFALLAKEIGGGESGPSPH